MCYLRKLLRLTVKLLIIFSALGMTLKHTYPSLFHNSLMNSIIEVALKKSSGVISEDLLAHSNDPPCQINLIPMWAFFHCVNHLTVHNHGEQIWWKFMNVRNHKLIRHCNVAFHLNILLMKMWSLNRIVVHFGPYGQLWRQFKLKLSKAWWFIWFQYPPSSNSVGDPSRTLLHRKK